MTDVYTLGEPLGVVSSGRVRHESEARLDVCGRSSRWPSPWPGSGTAARTWARWPMTSWAPEP
ncbi:hypothetical protein [Nonomuraea rubra]|uniref:hypothetical protein n=1 Tax=Nonomuraea rubra TaxID=46180 RepID=UPI0031ED3892